MKFRFVLLSPGEDPEGIPLLHGNAGMSPPARYEVRANGIYAVKQLRNGDLKSWVLANFSARIVGEIILDDGETSRREYRMEAMVGAKTVRFVVSGGEFARMGWVFSKLGPEAIVYPGQQQQLRAAIQSLSGPITRETVYCHLGWTNYGAQKVYVHAGGALGPNGTISDIAVDFPSLLRSFDLPARSVANAIQAIRASLSVLSIAPDRISIPLLASVYRAALGSVDFSVFLVGKSGAFKTAMSALCQQHFGRAMDASQLPTSFGSTAAAIEESAFLAKDAVLVVDDFVPTMRNGDRELQGVAERLFRAVGNRQGRGRMQRGQVRPPRPPRALILATGEAIPDGQSIRARLLVIDVGVGDVDRARLFESQKCGREGHLASSMGAFLQWVAKQYEQLQQRLRTRMIEIRNRARLRSSHARLPGMLAELQTGWEIFLDFALEAGAINSREKERLERRCLSALEAVGMSQEKYQLSRNPAEQFIWVIRNALASGEAHLADRHGAPPREADAWGWRRSRQNAWIPMGPRIGWISGDEVYLDSAMSFAMVQDVCGARAFQLSEQALRRRLRLRGILASVDSGRQMIQVRRILDGSHRLVLHLKARQLTLTSSE